MSKNKKIIIVSALAFILVIVGYFYIQNSRWNCFNRPACIRFEIIGEPRVGNPVQLKVEVTQPRNAGGSKATITLNLPPEIEVIDGVSQWETDLSINEISSQILTVQVNESGEWEIQAEAFIHAGAWDSEDFFIISSPTIGKSSEKISPNNWFTQSMKDTPSIYPDFDERFDATLTFSNTPMLNEEFTVTYTFTTKIYLEDLYLGIAFPPRGFRIVSVTPLQEEYGITENQVSWRGRLAANKSISLMITFKIIDVGRGNINAFSAVYLEEFGFTPTASSGYLEVTRYTSRYEIYKYP